MKKKIILTSSIITITDMLGLVSKNSNPYTSGLLILTTVVLSLDSLVEGVHDLQLSRKEKSLEKQASKIVSGCLSIAFGIVGGTAAYQESRQLLNRYNAQRDAELTDWTEQFLKGENTTSVKWKKYNSQEVLSKLKLLEPEMTQTEQTLSRTYKLRSECLERSHSKISTCQAYTLSSDPHVCSSTGEAFKAQWHPVRQEYQNQLVQKAVNSTLTLSQELDYRHPVTIAMRGNTASGKTRALRTEMASIKDLSGAINPDPIKYELIGQMDVTAAQAHREGAMLSKKIMDISLAQRPNINLVIDKRLDEREDIASVLNFRSNDRVEILDIDAPLEKSCLGVLTRRKGPDPLVPFDSIAAGYKNIRANRNHLIDQVKTNSEVEKYSLYVSDEGSTYFVASKKKGEFVISDPTRFKDAQHSEGIDIEIVETANKVITSSFLKEKYKVAPWLQNQGLESFLGLSIKDALDQHSKTIYR